MVIAKDLSILDRLRTLYDVILERKPRLIF